MAETPVNSNGDSKMNLSKSDLRIELSPSQLLRADEWLNNFYSKCKSRMSDPIVENGFLKISSADVYNFITAIEVNEHSRFDCFRLKASTLKSLSLISEKNLNPLTLQHYGRCKEMVGQVGFDQLSDTHS